MNRFIETYKDEVFDIIIIGGGITGAAVAYEAASRGLKTALVEKKDFGWATSAATSKLIHGGLRYLNNLEFSLVRESLSERRILENIAPNFVHPIPFLIAHYRSFMSSRMVLRTGLTLYDIMAFDKGNTWDRNKRIHGHRWLSKDETLELEPMVRSDGLTGGSIYYDCQSIFPERLTLAFIKTAAKHGAKVANYCEAVDFIRPDANSISGIRVLDRLDKKGKTVDINSKLVINCAGPWADIVLNIADKKKSSHHIKRSEGIHIITKKISSSHAVVLRTPAGRHFFTIPWRGHSITGTTDTEYSGSPDGYRVSAKSVQGLIRDINESYGKADLSMSDVLYAYGGLRPLVDEQTEGTYSSSRKYEIYDNRNDGIDCLITVEGGKYTTSRNLAVKVLDLAGKKLNIKLPASVSKSRYLSGCEIKNLNSFISAQKKAYPDFQEKTVEYVSMNYGTESALVFEAGKNNKRLRDQMSSDGEIAAEIYHAVTAEMAITLTDILFRRTGIATLGNPGDKILEKAAAIAARELGWKTKDIDRELLSAEQALSLPIK